MDTFGKLSISDPESKCNIVTPFYPENLVSEINPLTRKYVSPQDLQQVKTRLDRINQEYNGEISLCCDPNNPSKNQEVLKRYQEVIPSVRLIKKNGVLDSIHCSYVKKPASEGWSVLTPHLVCKLSSVSQNDIITTEDENVIIIKNLKRDCFTDNCDKADGITIEQLFEQGKRNINYTYYDDAKVVDSIKSGSSDGVEQYLFKYNKVNQILTHDDYGRRIIHIASIHYNEEIMNLILAVKPDLNKRDAIENTPLHYACMYGHIDLVDKLLKLGAEPNMKNKKGQTPIMLASIFKGKKTPKTDRSNDNSKMVRMMYNKGVSIMDIDNDGNNLLHYVLKDAPNTQEKSKLVRYLIERGIDIEKGNNKGITPLMYIHNKLESLKTPVPESAYQMEGFEVNEQKVHHFTDEERELLESQTMIFNSIIRRNPNKYGGYINVSEIPQGAPVEVLNYNCVGHDGIMGIEDEAECIRQGGNFVKIKNTTTKVKLELLPESEKEIDAIEQEELYYDKFPQPEIHTPLPKEIQDLNNSLRNKKGITSNNNNVDTTGEYVTRPEHLQISSNSLSKNDNANNNANNNADNNADNNANNNANNNASNTSSNSSEDLFSNVKHPDRKTKTIMGAEIEKAMTNSETFMDNLGSNVDKKGKNKKRLSFLKENFVLLLVLLLLFIVVMGVLFC